MGVEIQAKLLIVDDDSDITDILCEFLRPFFAEVHVANSGKEALAKLGPHHDYSLVITDMNMPSMNGIELLKTLRRRDDFVDLCILTGGMTLEERSFAFKLGVSEIFDKPFNFKTIVKRVDDIIRKNPFEQSKAA